MDGFTVYPIPNSMNYLVKESMYSLCKLLTIPTCKWEVGLWDSDWAWSTSPLSSMSLGPITGVGRSRLRDGELEAEARESCDTL